MEITKGAARDSSPERFLEELRDRARRYFPEMGRVGQLRVIEVKQRPYSKIYRVAINEPGRPAREVIVKQSEDARVHFRAMNAVWPHFAAHPTFKIPRPLDCLENALVMEVAPGVSLQKRLPWLAWGDRSLRNAVEDCRRAGGWLRFYHDLGRSPEPAPLDVDFKWKGVEESVAELADAGFDRGIGTRLVSYLWPLTERLEREPLPSSHVHGDFSPDNVLIDGPRVTALDLSAEFRNAVYHDIASFLNSLLLQRLTRPAQWWAIDRLRSAFLEGYFGGETYDETALVFLQGFGLASGLTEIVGRRRGAIARAWIERFFAEAIEHLRIT